MNTFLFDSTPVLHEAIDAHEVQSLRNERSKHEEFEARLMPVRNQLQRTALILTKSPNAAEALMRDTLIEARRLYVRTEPVNDFGFWISQLLLSRFVERNKQRAGTES